MTDFLGATRREIREGVDVEPTARFINRNGNAVQQADVDGAQGIDISVYEVNDTTPIYQQTGLDPSTGSPTGGAIIFDTLQVDGYWGADKKGYNFRYAVRHEDFAAGVQLEGGHLYRVEAIVHTVGSGAIKHLWVYDVKSTYQE